MTISNVSKVVQHQVWDYQIHGVDGEFWGMVSQAGDASGGFISLALNLINRGEYLETFYRIDDFTVSVLGDNAAHEALLIHKPALTYGGSQIYLYHKTDIDPTGDALDQAANKFLVDGWFPVWHRLPINPDGVRFGVDFPENNVALIYQIFLRGSLYFPRLQRYQLAAR